MSKRLALAIAAVMVLSGCRVVSQQELAALQSPVNPHLAQAGALYHEQMVPQVMKSAVPLARLIAQIEQAKDFDTACQQFGYRAQPEFPCHFSTQVSGEITAINTQSRSGRLTLKLTDGPIGSVDVQIGPVYRGTVNDQTLFGDFAKSINQASIAELAGFVPKVGDKITVYGVFTSWQLPAEPLLITPVRIQP